LAAFSFLGVRADFSFFCGDITAIGFFFSAAAAACFAAILLFIFIFFHAHRLIAAGQGKKEPNAVDAFSTT
jgi:hypothetical protein